MAKDQAADANLVGQIGRVSRYEILAPIGTGGMSTVYKAIDKEQDWVLAIKVLHQEYEKDKKKRRADYLGRENRIAASLNHPNVINIYGIVEEVDETGERKRYMIEEYIDGHDLRHYVNNRDWTMDWGLDIFHQICLGLDYIHQQGIVHHDIKPENFLVTRDGKTVKIVDFGLSKADHSWLTRRIKSRVGTPKYMSPEQIRDKTLDIRSDIFSLGLTMFEFFTGWYPFEAADRKQTMRAICREKLPPASRVNKKIPHTLDRIIHKATQKRRDKRYSTTTELIVDLDRMQRTRI